MGICIQNSDELQNCLNSGSRSSRRQCASRLGFVLVRISKFKEVVFVNRPVASKLIASYANWLGWRTATGFKLSM